MAIGNPITLTNNVASKSISVTATASQTLFTVTGGYRINQLHVFRNGVQLSQSLDFVANDGSTVILNTAANAMTLFCLESLMTLELLMRFPLLDLIKSLLAI